jgi:hypothetical protein
MNFKENDTRDERRNTADIKGIGSRSVDKKINSMDLQVLYEKCQQG